MLRVGFLALVWLVLPLLSCRPPPRPPTAVVDGRGVGAGPLWCGYLLVWWLVLCVRLLGVCYGPSTQKKGVLGGHDPSVLMVCPFLLAVPPPLVRQRPRYGAGRGSKGDV